MFGEGKNNMKYEAWCNKNSIRNMGQARIWGGGDWNGQQWFQSLWLCACGHLMYIILWYAGHIKLRCMCT